MSGMGWHADKRIKLTVVYLLPCPAPTVPEAMRECKYWTNERV